MVSAGASEVEIERALYVGNYSGAVDICLDVSLLVAGNLCAQHASLWILRRTHIMVSAGASEVTELTLYVGCLEVSLTVAGLVTRIYDSSGLKAAAAPRKVTGLDGRPFKSWR